jgi:integrase
MGRRRSDVGVKIRQLKGAWWVVVHHDGKRHMKRVGQGETARRTAEKVAEQLRAKLVLGQLDLGEKKVTPYPFDRFAAEWLRLEVQLPSERGIEGALAPSSVRQRAESLRVYLTPFFGDKDVQEIRVADVQRLHDHLVATGRPRSPRSIEIVLGCLRRILLCAQTQEIVVSNAVSDWKERRGRRRGTGVRPLERERVFESHELEALLAAGRREFPRDFGFLLFLADTGCRLGEGIGLQWRDVDLPRGEARIERSVDHLGRVGSTKTRRPRVVELTTRLHDALAGVPRPLDDSLPVFPSEGGGYRDGANFRNRVFNRLVRRALGTTRHASPHVLRHYAERRIMPTPIVPPATAAPEG